MKNLFKLILISNILSAIALAQTIPAEEDTLTYIQYPLINVPEILLPGDTLIIKCDLDAEESAQDIYLKKGSVSYQLQFTEMGTDPTTGLKELEAYIPDTILYSLYDLGFISSVENTDISENSVYVIPEYKDSYTFVHVTDTHLPSHDFWGDPGVETDSTELEDFRAVIDDINIINPAFVLHTGDLVNDGELEYLGVPAISRAKRLLHELNVPLYLVAGNHDLGGWDYTPGPAGTARKTWWKFFGWKYLDHSDGTSPITQDYSFKYGRDLYVGLEAYQLYGNYDDWRIDIYGSTSFTNDQLSWLDQTLDSNSESDMKVLFYHKDFDYDLDLSALGVDAAFWGHVHRNNEDTTPPYDISTGSTCDGNRWYRIVKVEHNEIVFNRAVQAGSFGQNLSIVSNQDSTTIRIINNHSLSLENCLVEFKLEDGLKMTGLTNARLYEIDSLSIPKIVYALVDVPANSYVNASIQTDSIETDIKQLPDSPYILRTYPNPFNPLINIDYNILEQGHLTINVYDVNGAKVDELLDSKQNTGSYKIIWNASDQPSGIYFIRADIKNASGNFQSIEKCLLMK
jgi:hypothetical protein